MHRQLILASALLVGIASAQTAPTLPKCATSCVTDLLVTSGCTSDPKCICNATGFLDNIGCCVFEACDAADQAAALLYAHSICDPEGASSLLPASATCTSGASTIFAGVTGTVTGTSGAASTASSASSAASSVSASLSSAASSVSASLSSAASSVSVSASSAASAASASATSATASPTGAAGQLVIGFGAVGAGLLGVAALL